MMAANLQAVTPPPVFIVGTHKDAISNSRFAEVKAQVDAIMIKKLHYLCDIRGVCYVSNITYVSAFPHHLTLEILMSSSTAWGEIVAEDVIGGFSRAEHIQTANTWYESYYPFCFVLFCFVLFCFVLFCFVLFCFVLFCFVLFCFVLFCFY